MTPITINKDQIPLWHGADGKVQVQVNVPTPADPLPVSPIAIASLSFSANGNTAIGNDVTLGVTASTSFELAALFKEETGADPALVTEMEIAPALRSDNFILAMDLGGKADISAAGSYKYSVLTAGATLEAGTDGRLVHTRPYQRTEPAGEVLLNFFKNLALPGTVTAPPPPGQVTSLEFGGYLNFGINASAGYQLIGTHDFQNIGDLKLSEHYQASITGKLSVTAKLAGRFSVKVQAAEDKHWARLSVTRQRNKELQIAADLNVGAQVDTQGLPVSGKEFLGALLGLRAKNWINMADSILQQAAAIQTPQDLANKLDTLSKIYVERYTGKAVDQFLPQDVKDLMARFAKVVDSYNNADNSAIVLFDRYLDVADTKLADVLTELEGLTSWDQFQGEVDPMLWNVVQQLTGGNILDFILKKGLGLSSMQDAAQKATDLIKNPAHTEIRKLIALAKQEFGLDPVVAEIAKFDTPDALKTQLSKVAQGVVERIIGKAVSQINKDDFKAVTAFVQELRKGEQGFFDKFDHILQEAASQAFSLDIGMAYDRADQRKALIDVDIRLVDEDGQANLKGQKFMRSAGLGDFSEILANYDPNVVRLREGQLTHNLSSSKGLTINIAGWHHNFQYSDMHKVVVNAEQQIQSTPTGMLNVFTTVELSAQHDQSKTTDKHVQEMHTNFTLRFLAETNTTITDSKFNQKDKDYLLDVITGQSATYASTLSDSNTTPAALAHLLAFAQDLGLDQKGATEEALQPILRKGSDGNYGPVSASYRVRFSDQGLDSLFKTGSVTEAQIRTILRRIIVSNYAGDDGLAPVAWLYCSDQVRDLALGQGGFINSETILGDALHSGQVQIEVPFAGMKPVVGNNLFLRRQVTTLFLIEKNLINAFLQLEAVVKKQGITLADLEKPAKSFGDALNSFESMAELSQSSSSPVFAVFDGLIQLATPASQARDSALALTVGAPDAQHQMLFQLVAVPQALPTAA